MAEDAEWAAFFQKGRQELDNEENVQLGYMHIPHADDTEDIVDDSEKAYDHHHSKEWNNLVEKKAQELEDDMKAEEAQKVADKQAAEAAKRKAIEEKAKAEAEKRKQAQQLAQQKTQKVKVQTVDFNDIYTGITPDEITLQTDSQVAYERHSKFWNNMVEN
jgi:vacuolar-type H+-ATPase catalytic subunit A/Vma1